MHPPTLLVHHPPPPVNAINFALDTLNKERAHATHIFIEIVALNELVIDKSAFYARLYLSVLVSAGVKHGHLPFWPSGVTSAPSTPAMQGRQITELTVFKRNIVQLGSKMYHISVNLAIGRREKIFGYKKLQGRQKGYKGWQKNSVHLFCSFFRLTFVVGPAKKSAGVSNGYVTPLFWTTKKLAPKIQDLAAKNIVEIQFYTGSENFILFNPRVKFQS